MPTPRLPKTLTNQQIVARIFEIGARQEAAILAKELDEIPRLFGELISLHEELRARNQWRLLVTLPKRRPLRSMTNEQIIARFVDLGLREGMAIEMNMFSKSNRLYPEKAALIEELKSRPGDQRRLLFDLYDHPNKQVQLNAAKATLALDLARARAALEALTVNKLYYQAGDAGMCLWALDQGISEPT
jgi:hypothetical protein